MALDGNRIGSDHFTESAPNYDAFGREAKTSVGVAAGLIAGTLALTWLFRGTAMAYWAVWLYLWAPLAPLPGILVFGAALTLGRYYGLTAAVSEDYGAAFVASAVVAVAYAAFGAGILALYPVAIHADALAIAMVVTAGITVGAAKLVFTTGYDFSGWDAYSGALLLGGIFLFWIGATISASTLVWIGFAAVLLGWIVDLVYEIYMVSDASRSPVANGIGVYVAFMGVFVHVLQLVLRAMAESE